MARKNINWVVGGLTLMLTLASLFGGQLLWNKYAVVNPINNAVQSIKGVESVAVSRLNEQGDSKNIKIYVKLAQVANLQKLYAELEEALKQVHRPQRYELVIQDSRTPELEQFYHSIHYSVQEAVFTGNFTAMAGSIAAKAGSAGVEAQTYVDTKNIYLQMTKGTNEMYVVVTRDSNRAGVQ
ncbi:hypothetical protein [Sporomusa termitida]|uniref:Uncharacterized protein n=1 Tax=Sporomusa termitida TaxID=2377 RepID=A0A517DV21_9FIRM|nr:hypothetical protein [Sporomusa termitida]QDR81126.1 hypothetical protein SPTER_24830 [Sporomusa termitida]